MFQVVWRCSHSHCSRSIKRVALHTPIIVVRRFVVGWIFVKRWIVVAFVRAV